MSTARDTLQEHANELEAAAERKDAKPTIVVLAALANDEDPPEWALRRLVDE